MANVLNRNTLEYKKSVNTVDYLDGNWLINPNLESVQGVQKRYWIIDGNTVREMDASEKVAVDADDLPEYKKKKISQIDEKTNEIISSGFEFDGKKFSLSLEAQQNWTGMQVAVSQGYLTKESFPFEIATLNNNAYNLQWNHAPAFFQQVLYEISTRLAIGRTLKARVNASTTIEEVDTIEDNR